MLKPPSTPGRAALPARILPRSEAWFAVDANRNRQPSRWPPKPPDLVYGVDDVPPIAKLVALGFQYAVLVGVYLIIVVLVARAAKVSPEVTTDLVSLGLVAAAVGTAVQAWNGRLFGSGFLAPPVYSAIYFGPAILAAKAGGLPAVAGMTIFAALVEIGLSRLLDRLRVVFQPIIAGFAVLRRRLAARLRRHVETLDVADETAPDFPWHVAVAFVTLGACIAFSIWGRGVLRLVSTLLGLALGVVARDRHRPVRARRPSPRSSPPPWIDLPDPSFISYGFEPALIPAFVAAATGGDAPHRRRRHHGAAHQRRRLEAPRHGQHRPRRRRRRTRLPGRAASSAPPA